MAARICSIPCSTACGPRLQFTPTETGSNAATAAGTSRARRPDTVSASSPTVTCTISGRPDTERTAPAAARSSSSDVNVSSANRSTPLPSSAAAWAANAADIASGARSPGAPPSGPIDPATSTSRPATSRASRASFTPAWFTASKRSSSLWAASLTGFAPYVFVRTMSAPARMKATCSATTCSGAIRFASSAQRARTTAVCSSDPIPPSDTSGSRPSRSRVRAIAAV